MGRPASLDGPKKHVGVYVVPDDHPLLVEAARLAKANSLSAWAAGVLVRQARAEVKAAKAAR